MAGPTFMKAQSSQVDSLTKGTSQLLAAEHREYLDGRLMSATDG